MPVPLMETPQDDTEAPRERRVARSTARAFAAAISALLIATLVVARSGSALEAEGTESRTNFAAGTISLVDDDRGRWLFDLSDMAPGRPAVECIEVTYDGSILPVELAMRARGNGALMPYLQVTVDEGEGAEFRDCDGFVATRNLYRDDLEALTDQEWLPLGPINNTGDSRSYRIEFELADEQDALGKTADAGFEWEVTPS